MGADLPQGIEPSELKRARRQLGKLLKKVSKAARSAGRDVAIDVLCVGVEAIPIPLLGRTLSRTLRNLLTPTASDSTADLEGVVAALHAMQQSDDAFREGLREFGLDLDEIAGDVRIVRELMIEQTTPRLELASVETELRWPVLDNQISALLVNAGGRTVYVHEIVLVVEDWRPLTRLDYSVPAAPLAKLHLRVALNTKTDVYELLALNGEPERQLNANGAGSERLIIDARSRENVEYSIRLRIPYTELDGRNDALVWPPVDEPPVRLPFECAPGWRAVDIDDLHDRVEVYDGLKKTLSALAVVLSSHPAGTEERHQALERLGIPWSMGAYLFPQFLSCFVPFLIRLAPPEDSDVVLALAQSLLDAADPDARARLADDGVIAAALAELSTRPSGLDP